jgi:hypothetical protein
MLPFKMDHQRRHWLQLGRQEMAMSDVPRLQITLEAARFWTGKQIDYTAHVIDM